MAALKTSLSACIAMAAALALSALPLYSCGQEMLLPDEDSEETTASDNATKTDKSTASAKKTGSPELEANGHDVQDGVDADGLEAAQGIAKQGANSGQALYAANSDDDGGVACVAPNGAIMAFAFTSPPVTPNACNPGGAINNDEGDDDGIVEGTETGNSAVQPATVLHTAQIDPDATRAGPTAVVNQQPANNGGGGGVDEDDNDDGGGKCSVTYGGGGPRGGGGGEKVQGTSKNCQCPGSSCLGYDGNTPCCK